MVLHGSKQLETERLILRQFKKGDETQMFKNYCNDERVCEYVTWKPHKIIEDTLSYVNLCLKEYNENGDKQYKWAIILKETNQIIGSIDGLRVDENKKTVALGYVIGYSFWGKGYVPEAANQLLKYFFEEEGFVRVSAWHNVLNHNSGRVMQKIGMTKEGILRKSELDSDQNFIDVTLYAITDDDYFNK